MTASFVSSSLRTGRLTFIWPLDSLQHCWLQCKCLEPPDLSDLIDTHEEVDSKLWSLSNPQSGQSVGNGGGAAHNSCCPILNFSLSVASGLIPGKSIWSHIWAPHIIQQLLGGFLVVVTGLDCES